MKKMLYILNVANRVNSFSYTSMLAAQELGYEYHIAGNWKYKNEQERIDDEKKYGIHIYQIDFIRTPYHPGNYKAYKQLKVIVEREKFDVIHCNTPIGGVVGRLLGKRCRVPTVIYQAHGFHFYKGAPILNWLIYYPIERVLAHYTDILITINQEDYQRAQSFKLRNHGKVYYVPGVGIDISQYRPRDFDRAEKRKELCLADDDIAVVSAGDLIDRKNYMVSIEAVARADNKRVQYFICGEGPKNDSLHRYAKELGVYSQIHFLGYRKDIKELMWASDIFLLSSLQEGLPRSLSEAMASGLPCIVSKIRGNIDLLVDNENGYLIDPDNADGFAKALNELSNNSSLRYKMGIRSIHRVVEFDIDSSKQAIGKIYRGD